MKLFARLPWAAFIGAALGVFFAPLIGLTQDVAEEAYDWLRPVVDSHAEVTYRTASDWRVVMYSTKNRDCRLVEVQAYDVSPARDVVRLRFEREDGAPPSGMLTGKFRSSTYVVAPPPVHRLDLSFLHDCGGRIVRTKVPIK